MKVILRSNRKSYMFAKNFVRDCRQGSQKDW
jgi:hypothetical protein